MPKITDILKQEHAAAKQLFEEYKLDGAESVLIELCNALVKHMKLEEEIVYPVFDDSQLDAIKHSYDEHNEARQFIDDARNLDGNQKKLAMQELESRINHHVQEEESVIFPKAEEELSEAVLEQLGIDYIFKLHEEI